LNSFQRLEYMTALKTDRNVQKRRLMYFPRDRARPATPGATGTDHPRPDRARWRATGGYFPVVLGCLEITARYGSRRCL
jgi:hypothetical protein